MSTLYDFIHTETKTLELPKASALSPETQTSLTALVANNLVVAKVQEDKAHKFAARLVELVASDTFLRELSDDIREPGLTETEDAFVARSRAVMMKLLDKHLS